MHESAHSGSAPEEQFKSIRRIRNELLFKAGMHPDLGGDSEVTKLINEAYGHARTGGDTRPLFDLYKQFVVHESLQDAGPSEADSAHDETDRPETANSDEEDGREDLSFGRAMEFTRLGFDAAAGHLEIWFDPESRDESDDELATLDEYIVQLGSGFPQLKNAISHMDRFREEMLAVDALDGAQSDILKQFCDTSKEICANRMEVLAETACALSVTNDPDTLQSLQGIFNQEFGQFARAMQELTAELMRYRIMVVGADESHEEFKAAADEEDEDFYDTYDDEDEEERSDNVIPFSGRRARAVKTAAQAKTRAATQIKEELDEVWDESDKRIFIRAFNDEQVRFWRTLMNCGLLEGTIDSTQDATTLIATSQEYPWFGATDMPGFVRINRAFRADYPGKLKRVKDRRRDRYYPEELFFDATGKAFEYYMAGDWDLFMKRPEYARTRRMLEQESEPAVFEQAA